MHRENEGMKDGQRDLENDKRKERDWDFDVADRVALFRPTHGYFQ